VTNLSVVSVFRSMRIS